MIEDHPDEPEGWSCFANELSLGPPGSAKPRDLDRAISLLQQALDRPVVDARAWELDLRLEELLEERAAMEEKQRRDGRAGSARRRR